MNLLETSTTWVSINNILYPKNVLSADCSTDKIVIKAVNGDYSIVVSDFKDFAVKGTPNTEFATRDDAATWFKTNLFK